MLLYYITDRSQFPGSEPDKRRRLLDKVAEAAGAGIDYTQLRERDLTTRELERLARECVSILREVQKTQSGPSLLINSRTDVAIAVGAAGVHLRSDDIAASEARSIFVHAGITQPVIAVSCHSSAEVELAAAHGADFVVFGPIYGKRGSSRPPLELTALRRVTSRKPPSDRVEAPQALHIPVLALGGVTLENALECVQAGAAGIAAIRLFQENDVAEVARVLRAQV